MTRLTAFLVWMNTVPGPVNLHTRPSPDAKPEMMPPDATRSITYFVFQATKWPLSTIYFSPSTSCHGLYQHAATVTQNFCSGKTYILPDNGAETRQPQQASPADLVDPQALAAEHGLAQPLPLVLLDDALRAG